MDDPDEDWELDDHYNCEYLGGGGGGECNVRWVLEKGLDLGKKVVITSFVMSSAPVVLPPILVVSAVGFACSVPFGLVFTGYACTQKLMSKLLPMPTASPMLEYDEMFGDEVEETEERGEGKDRIESGVYLEEEKGQMNDLSIRVEESIELVENENDVLQKDDDSKDIGRYDQMFDDEVEKMEGRGGGNNQIESRVYMEEEEKEQIDNQREESEESIDLVKSENEVPREFDDSKDFRREVYKDGAEEVEGGRVGNDQIESQVHTEEEEKEQMDDQSARIEESIELVKHENEMPQEEDDLEDIRRDDELRMSSENTSLKEEGYEEDVDEPLEYGDESSEEVGARAVTGQEEAINEESKSEEVFPKNDALNPSDWSDSREEEKEKMDDLRVGIEESNESVKNENEVPREDDDPKDIRRDNELRMTCENISLNQGHEEDNELVADTNESSEEMVAHLDAGQGESINQESTYKELFHMEDGLKPSDLVDSRVEENEKMDDVMEGAEESIELVKNELPPEDDASKDIRGDNELRMTTENISLNKGHAEDDELVADNHGSSEEMVAQAEVGQEESTNQELESKELFPMEDALKPLERSNPREEEKEQIEDGVEESIELLNNENEMPLEDDASTDIRRENEQIITSENINLKEGHEEDDISIVCNNESSDEIAAREDMGQEESVDQQSKSNKRFLKEDDLTQSNWIDSREGEWEVTELKIEGEEDIGTEESINGDFVHENVGPEIFGEFSERQTRVNNDEEDIKRGSVGLLEKIKDEGNADDSAIETRYMKKKMTSEGSAGMLLPEVKDQSAISKNLIVGNGVTENQQSGPDDRLEDSSIVVMQQPPVGGAAGSDDLVPLQENFIPSYLHGEPDKTIGNEGEDPMVIQNVEVVEISISSSRPKAALAESTEVDAVLQIEEEFVDEEKIREQIEALRKIVGYKSATYRSSIEEVKALYTFTGVELPSSFGDPSDLAELGNKLRFLMSILGVK